MKMGVIGQNIPQVSVIVPFYNIKPYVSYCMDSLLCQDFEDYEIICVDDGSTDETGNLLDSYAKNEFRVHVIHKPNGGLSDARNKGVAESRGELIAFVDGDDVVSPYYLSSLVSAMGTTKKHCMVFGGIKTVSFSKDVQEKRITWERPEEFKELTRDEVLSAILYDEIQPAACAKLASREIYEEVPFPVGVHYEEIRTILKFIQKVDTYKVFDKDIYGYVMRKGSITWSSKVSTQQLKEYREAIDIICVDAAKINPTAVEAIRYQRALLDARAHSQLPKDARNCPNIKLIDDQIIKDLHKVLRLNLKNHQVRISSKLRFLLLVYARPIYDRLYCIFRKKVKKVK